MKLVIYLVAVIWVNEISSQWTLQNYDTNYTLYDIDFINENTGFAAGEKYYPLLRMHKSVIFKTTNAGLNWRPTFADTGLYLHAVGIINANTILAGGGIFSIIQPILLKSTDLGESWTNINPDGLNSKINSFQNFGGLVYATCASGIYKSTNNGLSWVRSVIGSGEFAKGYFINENTGWYACDNGYIFKTTSGGANWSAIYINNDFTYAHPTFFVNENTGFVIYDSSYTFSTRIIKTTNGGANWNQLNLDFINHHWSIGFINPNTGYISGSGGNIAKTTDGGNSWNISPTEFSNANFMDVLFLNPYTGYVCGSNSVIIKTINGGFIGLNPVSGEIPKEFLLYQNYPNPFNPTTKIKFSLPKSAFVKLSVYDLLGRKIRQLVNQQLSAGIYNVDWNASKFSSGIYLYKLTTDNFSAVRKMSLVK